MPRRAAEEQGAARLQRVTEACYNRARVVEDRGRSGGGSGGSGGSGGGGVSGGGGGSIINGTNVIAATGTFTNVGNENETNITPLLK